MRFFNLVYILEAKAQASLHKHVVRGIPMCTQIGMCVPGFKLGPNSRDKLHSRKIREK